MQTHPTRVGRGELLAAVAALVLLVLLFAAKWYGPGVIASGVVVGGTVNGWHGLLHLRWLLVVAAAWALVVAAWGLLVAPAAGAGRSARARAVADGLVALLGLASVLWLGYRVLISIPPGEKAPAYVGLACAVAILAGGSLALRDAIARGELR